MHGMQLPAAIGFVGKHIGMQDQIGYVLEPSFINRDQALLEYFICVGIGGISYGHIYAYGRASLLICIFGHLILHYMHATNLEEYS